MASSTSLLRSAGNRPPVSSRSSIRTAASAVVRLRYWFSNRLCMACSVADDQCVADQVADRQSASLRNGVPQRTVRVPRQLAFPEGEETVRRQAGPARGVQHGQRLIEFADAHRGQLGFPLDAGDHPAVAQYGDGYRRLPVPEESPDAFFERAVAGGHVCCGERQAAQTDDSFYGVGYHMIRIYGSAATPFFGPCGRNGNRAGRKGKTRTRRDRFAVTDDMPFPRNRAVLFAGRFPKRLERDSDKRSSAYAASSVVLRPASRNAGEPDGAWMLPAECDAACRGVYSG